MHHAMEEREYEISKAVKRLSERKICYTVNSGTAASYAALLAADIKQDDEVLLPSFYVCCYCQLCSCIW